MDNVDISFEIERLVLFGLQHKMIEDLDVIPVRNSLMDLLNVEEPYKGQVPEEASKSLQGILDNILDYSAKVGNLPSNTVTYRDLFDARIMGLLMPRQSEVAKKFWESAEKDGIKKAVDDFYSLSINSNYIRMDRIAKNLYWKKDTQYGPLEITINLSKPEIDPRDIAAIRQLPQSSYPKCLLCVDNVGYAGGLNHPARQNHRVIPVTLNKEQWFFQYSPYVYYNEHCIVFDQRHIPMEISEKTFLRLLDFIEHFPHYFIGSNADIPIVGGSILSHEHFQGGHHIFPMEEAPVERFFMHDGFENVKVGVLKWPMSVIRISGHDRRSLTDMAAYILRLWRNYSNQSVDILAFTEENNKRVPHNTITPIARRNGRGEYELDLVLRNNRTSDLYPLGIFHPHDELHHIKKENIGLIEVMGLAVLPGRLEYELREIGKILTGEVVHSRAAYNEDSCLYKHIHWIEELINIYGTKLEAQEAMSLLKQEVAEKFLKVLLDCAVFKKDEKGKQAFERFITSLGFKAAYIG